MDLELKLWVLASLDLPDFKVTVTLCTKGWCESEVDSDFFLFFFCVLTPLSTIFLLYHGDQF